MVADVLIFIFVTNVRSQPQYCMLKSSTETDVRRMLVYLYYHNTSQVLIFRFHQQIVCSRVCITQEEMKHSNVYRDCR